MAIVRKVPGSVLNQHKFIVYGSRDKNEVAKKKAFQEWLGNYINFINNKRFGYIKEFNQNGKTDAEKNQIAADLDDAEKLLNNLRDLYEKLSKDLGMSEDESRLDGEVKGINMGKSQKYIESLITHARACFADYMMTKFEKPDRSLVDSSNEAAVKRFQKEEEEYEYGVSLARARYHDRASLANLMIVEHYKMAKEMGMKKYQVSFSLDFLPCDGKFYNDYDEEMKFLNNGVMKREKQLYDELHEKYNELFEESKTDSNFDASRLKRLEEMLELQKNNMLDLKNSKKKYENVLANNYDRDKK